LTGRAADAKIPRIMKRVMTILGYAFVTTLCGFIVLAVSASIFQTDRCPAGSSVPVADRIVCAGLGVVIFSLVLVCMAVYDRYKLYKSFYYSMLRRIERLRML